MAEWILTQVTSLLCLLIFFRLFTFRRGALAFNRMKSCLAWLVMACAGATVIHILLGQLSLPLAAWPLVGMLGVFAWVLWRAGGNLAGALRADEPAWTGSERRRIR